MRTFELRDLQTKYFKYFIEESGEVYIIDRRNGARRQKKITSLNKKTPAALVCGKKKRNFLVLYYECFVGEVPYRKRVELIDPEAPISVGNLKLVDYERLASYLDMRVKAEILDRALEAIEFGELRGTVAKEFLVSASLITRVVNEYEEIGIPHSVPCT